MGVEPSGASPCTGSDRVFSLYNRHHIIRKSDDQISLFKNQRYCRSSLRRHIPERLYEPGSSAKSLRLSSLVAVAAYPSGSRSQAAARKASRLSSLVAVATYPKSSARRNESKLPSAVRMILAAWLVACTQKSTIFS